MFGSLKSGANAYAKVGLETGVVAASPHQLTLMLLEGAMTAIVSAGVHMQARQIEMKGNAISKAIMIIESGMRASLDKKAGGEIAARLDSLYDYMGRRLMLANVQNDQAILKEVHGLLGDIKSAWEEIGNKVNAPAPVPARPAMAYDSLAPRASNYVSA